MAKTYSELLQETKAAIKQVSLEDLKARLESGEKITLVDVREKDEWRQGYIPGAIHLPRGFLEMQATSRLPDKKAKIITYSAGGIRSAFAAKALMDLGYEDVKDNFSEGAWKDVSVGDGVYGAPIDGGPMGMIYRKDVFETYGITPPTTTMIRPVANTRPPRSRCMP